MAATKIGLQKLYNWDNQHGTSITRELEMHVDSVLINTAYALQFWTDVRLYGIDEALLYLKRTNLPVHQKEMKELEAFIYTIRTTMGL